MSLEKENITHILQTLKKIAPEEMDTVVKRYHILREISSQEPIGRRSISLSLDFSERTVRNETEKLSKQQLIEVSREGMKVTQEGKKILQEMKTFMQCVDAIMAVEKKLSHILGITEVHIAQGDYQNTQSVKKEMAQIAAKVILNNVTKESTVAVTGGSTLARVVEAMLFSKNQKVKLVVPARGSIGGKLEYQADTLAAILAQKLNASYKLLHLPDHMSEKAFKEIKQEPTIEQTIQEIRRADVLILGVGNAMEIKKKRQVDSQVYSFLLKERAVAEMLGYYLDSSGKVVYTSHSIGLRLEELNRMRKIIVVAAGKNKAEALVAVFKKMPQAILITDTATAEEMIRLAE